MQNTKLLELESQNSSIKVQILWIRASNTILADEAVICCNYLKCMLTGFTALVFALFGFN